MIFPKTVAARVAPVTPLTLAELHAHASDLTTFDHLLPQIAALNELELLVLIGLFLVDERIHQAHHAASIFRFGLAP